MKISVIINALNSEKHLDVVLDSVKGFDEVVVCDMGSTDATADIARAHGAKVLDYPTNDGKTLEDARNFALNNVKHPWAFYVEPNEIVPPALKKYLYDFIEQAADGVDGLFVARKNFMMYRFRKSSYPDYRLRLVRESKTHIPNKPGAMPSVEGEVKSIPASRQDLALVHLSTRFQRDRDRNGRAIKIDNLQNSDRPVTLAMMFINPLATFLKTYILKGTIFYGKDGFVVAARNASDYFMQLVEIHESRRIKAFNEEHAPLGIHIKSEE